MRLPRILAVGFVVAAAALLPGRAQTQAPTMLVATVGTGDAFVINLRDAAGNLVTQLDPGTYTILVNDRSGIHNFHLTGPGVDMATAVAFVGEATWTVTVADGRYTYICDVHPATMNGAFTAGNPPPPPAAPGRLAGSVGPGKRITLADETGARVSQLAAGRYVVSVRDRTKLDNFHLQGPGVNRKTGVGFVGRASWTVTLRDGRYNFRSDRTRTLRRTFLVAST